MKKLIYVAFLAIGITGCSVDSLDSTDKLTTADAKFKIQEAQDPMGLYKNNGDLRGTVAIWNDCDNLFIQLTPEDEMPDDIKLGIFSEGVLPSENGFSGEMMYDLDDAENLVWSFNIEDEEFDVDASLNIFFGWGNSWLGTEVLGDKNNAPNYHIFNFNLDGCGDCEESYSYELNEDGSYTFTYIPEEDIDGAEVVFTFAQGTVVSGYEWVDWNGNSSTRTEIMNLEACETYTWTVSLVPDCSGQGNSKGNVWTDFKVNGNSKKNEDTPNIEIGC